MFKMKLKKSYLEPYYHKSPYYLLPDSNDKIGKNIKMYIEDSIEFNIKFTVEDAVDMVVWNNIMDITFFIREGF